MQRHGREYPVYSGLARQILEKGHKVFYYFPPYIKRCDNINQYLNSLKLMLLKRGATKAEKTYFDELEKNLITRTKFIKD